MHSIYIASIEPYSGKTLFCLGLGLLLKDKKLKPGYFKPFGYPTTKTREHSYDEDALIGKNILHLHDSCNDICPVGSGNFYNMGRFPN